MGHRYGRRMRTGALAAATAAACLMMVLLPASAQQVVVPADDAMGKAAVLSFPADVAEEVDVFDRRVDATALERDQQPLTFGRRAGTVAATIFRVLASQNQLRLGVSDDWMDGYLRPPSEDAKPTMLLEAKQLYDEATTYRTDRFDMRIDPFSLEARLTLRLSRYLGTGSE